MPNNNTDTPSIWDNNTVTWNTLNTTFTSCNGNDPHYYVYDWHSSHIPLEIEVNEEQIASYEHILDSMREEWIHVEEQVEPKKREFGIVEFCRRNYK